MGGAAKRVGAAVVTGGQSEIYRGVKDIAGAKVATAISPVGAIAKAAGKALFPTIPKPNLGTVDTAQQELAAKNAVQTQEAEARRARAAKRISSVLTGGLGLPGSAPTSSATLQPSEPRKSVLG